MTSTRLVVGVCTSRRPDRLRSLIESLARMNPVEVDWQLHVVDNPGTPESEAIARSAYANLQISYVALDRAGIASARNAAIESAIAAGAEAIAFIDDDERADAGWLRELWAAHAANPGSVINGPARTVLPEDCEQWIPRSGLADRPEHDDGSILEHCPTCNVLIPIATIGEARFDERFDSTGGEDTDFTSRLAAAGAEIRYCAKAIVHEDWDSTRANSSYLRSLAHRKASIYALVMIEQRGGRGAVRVAAEAAWNALGGVLLVLAGSLSASRALRERGRVELRNSAGKFAVLLGRDPIAKPDWN